MYCVITGASSGFGAEFAFKFAKRNYNLCLAARSIDKLQDLKQKLEEQFSVSVDIIQTDLSRMEEVQKLHDFTKDKDVDVLVNNAGVLYGGLPHEADIQAEMQMIDTNVKAVHYLTRLFLVDMIKKDRGRILNMSSVSGWTPTPMLGTYGACKSFILSFSESLIYELRKMKSKVQVSVVTPGFFNTNIAGKKYRLADQKRSVSSYIEKTVQKFLKGHRIIIMGQDVFIPILARAWPRIWMHSYVYSVIESNLKRSA